MYGFMEFFDGTKNHGIFLSSMNTEKNITLNDKVEKKMNGNWVTFNGWFTNTPRYNKTQPILGLFWMWFIGLKKQWKNIRFDN